MLGRDGTHRLGGGVVEGTDPLLLPRLLRGWLAHLGHEAIRRDRRRLAPRIRGRGKDQQLSDRVLLPRTAVGTFDSVQDRLYPFP